MMPLTVLVLSGSEPRFFEKLREMNAFVVYMGDDLPLEIALLVDHYIPLSLEGDWRDVLRSVKEEMRDRTPDAVVTYLDRYVPLAAYLRERLGTGHGPPLAAVQNCRDKFRMRRLLENRVLPNVPHRIAGDDREALAAASSIGYPVVVKPRIGVGGIGVKLCRDEGDVRQAAKEISDVSEVLFGPDAPKQMILVEGYLQGTVLAVQTVTHQGSTDVVSVVETRVGPFPLFFELEHRFPPRLSPDALNRVERTAKETVRVLGLDDCVTHMQLCLTEEGPVLIEVNPRVPGGNLVDLTAWTTGIDLYRASVDLALGCPPERSTPAFPAAVSFSIGFSKSGTVSYIPDAVSWRRNVLIRMDVLPGEKVYALTHPEGGIYGRILVAGKDGDEVDEKVREIRDALALEVG